MQGSIDAIKDLLIYGQKAGKVKDFQDISVIAMNLVMWLEGLNLTAIVASLDEKVIEK